jgi:antitoxin ParD1/3/4
MRKSTSILLDDDSEAFIGKKISEGRFNSPSEVVEAGLRLLKNQDEEIDAIRAALIEGEESGEPRAFDFDAFLAGKRAQRAKSA